MKDFEISSLVLVEHLILLELWFAKFAKFSCLVSTLYLPLNVNVSKMHTTYNAWCYAVKLNQMSFNFHLLTQRHSLIKTFQIVFLSDF